MSVPYDCIQIALQATEDIKQELTNALVLQHFQKFLYAFIPSLKCLFLRFYSKFQFLQQ